MAVVALFAYSCATDTTEDLGVQLDKNAGQTSLSISLEGTKTHIGAKAEDAYPLYWSAGDQIAINGVASHPLTEAAHGQASAEFIFDGELAYPYNLVYPAPAPEVVAAEGLQAVTFLATQKYTPGTFAEGAAPLYAYTEAAAEGEEQLPIEIKHLSGVLCFVPQGDVTLTSMTVTSSIGKLAGNFDLNCQNGKLTAHEDATETITVDFGEGLALSAEGQDHKSDHFCPGFNAVEQETILPPIAHCPDLVVPILKSSIYGSRHILVPVQLIKILSHTVMI